MKKIIFVLLFILTAQASAHSPSVMKVGHPEFGFLALCSDIGVKPENFNLTEDVRVVLLRQYMGFKWDRAVPHQTVNNILTDGVRFIKDDFDHFPALSIFERDISDASMVFQTSRHQNYIYLRVQALNAPLAPEQACWAKVTDMRTKAWNEFYSVTFE